MAGNREQRVRLKLTKALEAKGWLVIKTDASTNFSLPAGFPDLMIIKKRRWTGIVRDMAACDVHFIEIKVPKWRDYPKTYPSKVQKKMIERLRKKGYQVRVARSLDDVADLL